MAGNSGRGLQNADQKTREEVARLGGEASRGGGRQSQSEGEKGGQSQADNLSQEDRSRGGSMSGGNFKNDPQRASEAGREGGSK